MLHDADNLPANPADLRDLVMLLASELKRRDLKITKLEHQLAGPRRHRFGPSSEVLDQLKLSLEDTGIEAAVESADQPTNADTAEAGTKNKPKRKLLPDHRPRNEEVLSPATHVARAVASARPWMRTSARNWSMFPAGSW